MTSKRPLSRPFFILISFQSTGQFFGLTYVIELMYSQLMPERSIQSSNANESTGSGKPVVLHVLHSWGGGVDCFARDLQAGDHHRKHFFLKSHSRNSLPPFGKELCLYQNLDSDPLATWHLAAPVMDTEPHSDEVARILQSIIEKWTVGAVIVSSLIGHSIDVLDTGLPTAFAVHDVYPFWPLLHDANTDDHSVEHLTCSLLESTEMNIFAEHSADYWIAIREKLIATILKNDIVCISPSKFARDRVCRFDPRLNDVRWVVIQHGIDIQVSRDITAEEKTIGRLKVLVPGHINGAKGEVLLRELLPHLPNEIEFVLLGSAHLSEQFASEHVTTIDHYQRSELGDIVAKIQPDIALLASTVPETYGYVFSEMLQLGVPIICSNIGAFAERAPHLPGVTLVSPDVESFLQALITFRDKPELLEAQRKYLPFVFPNLMKMANAWADVLPASPPQWLFEFTDDPNIENEVKMNLQLTHLSELLKAVHVATEQNTKSSNEALESINRQQSSMDSLVENTSMQSQQLAALLAKQDKLEAALMNKNKEIAWLTSHAGELKNAFQEQITLADNREKSFKEAIEILQSELKREVAVIRDEASADSSELRTKINSLNDELKSMRSKRLWRIIKFFK